MIARLYHFVPRVVMQVAGMEQKWLQGTLSLQKMWYFLQPSLRTFQALDSLCSKVGLLCLIRSVGSVRTLELLHPKGGDARACSTA